MNYQDSKIEMITLRGLSNCDISNTGIIKNWLQLPTLIQLVRETLWINGKVQHPNYLQLSKGR